MDLNRFRDRVIVLLITIVVSVVLLLLDSVGVVGSLYNLSSLAGVPFRLKMHEFSLQVNDIFGAFNKIATLRQENEELKESNRKFLEELSALEEYKSENEALKDQLGLEEFSFDWIIEGRVIGSDIALSNTLQINVGAYEQVEEGDIVVYGNYAIGEVKRVEKYSSKVLLITSPSSNIPVRGQINRAGGLVKGDVGPTLKMSDILPDEVIEEGEIVVTSGVESEFPAGLIIGIVSEVNSNPAFAIQEAKVEVQIDFGKLDYIYVVKGQK